MRASARRRGFRFDRRATIVAGALFYLGAALLLQQAHEPALTGDDPSPADLVKP